MIFTHKLDNGFDTGFTELIQGSINEFFTFIFSNITYLGDVFLIALLYIILFLFLKDKVYAIKYLVLVIASSLVAEVFKKTIKRPRPFEDGYLTPDGVKTTSSSFPSGHSINIAIGSFTYNRVVNPKNHLIPILEGVVISLLVAWSRIYLGQHYLTDVIAGLILGSILFILLDKPFYKLFTKMSKIKSRKLIGLIVIFVALAVCQITGLFISYNYLLAILLGFQVGLLFVQEVYVENKFNIITIAATYLGFFILGQFLLGVNTYLGLSFYILMGIFYSLFAPKIANRYLPSRPQEVVSSANE